jgi:hypothetical protein
MGYTNGLHPLGKKTQRCQSCKEYRVNAQFFHWIGIITEQEVCLKCAKLEGYGRNK